MVLKKYNEILSDYKKIIKKQYLHIRLTSFTIFIQFNLRAQKTA